MLTTESDASAGLFEQLVLRTLPVNTSNTNSGHALRLVTQSRDVTGGSLLHCLVMHRNMPHASSTYIINANGLIDGKITGEGS